MMKKLLILLTVVFALLGCSEKDIEEMTEGLPEKGAKFKVYTYDEKVEILRKVHIFDENNERVYPRVTEEYHNLLEILGSESRYGNKIAKKESKEWSEIKLFRKWEKKD